MDQYQGILAEEINLHSGKALEQEEESARIAHQEQQLNAGKHRQDAKAQLK